MKTDTVTKEEIEALGFKYNRTMKGSLQFNLIEDSSIKLAYYPKGGGYDHSTNLKIRHLSEPLFIGNIQDAEEIKYVLKLTVER